MNQTTMDYEREIALKQLCIEVLRQWRVLLAVMVAFALLLGGITLLKQDKTPLSVMTAQQIADTTAAISANEGTIASYNASIPVQKENLPKEEEELELLVQARGLVLQSEELTAEQIDALIDLNARIEAKEAEIVGIEKNIASMESAIPALQSQNESLRAQMAETYVPATDYAGAVKKAVLGAIVGAVLVCCWVFLRYLMDGTLQSQEEISEQVGIPVLGSIYVKALSPKQGKIDQLLDKLEGAGKAVDEAAVCEVAAAKLRVTAGDNKKVLLTGTLPAEKLQEVSEKLQSAMPESALNIAAVENIASNATAILQIPECTILLVEAVGETKMKEFTKMLEMLLQSKAKIAGAFIL